MVSRFFFKQFKFKFNVWVPAFLQLMKRISCWWVVCPVRSCGCVWSVCENRPIFCRRQIAFGLGRVTHSAWSIQMIWPASPSTSLPNPWDSVWLRLRLLYLVYHLFHSGIRPLLASAGLQRCPTSDSWRLLIQYSHLTLWWVDNRINLFSSNLIIIKFAEIKNLGKNSKHFENIFYALIEHFIENSWLNNQQVFFLIGCS